MWYIASIAILIFAIITEDADIHNAHLIAAGLFAIAGEIGVISTRLKKFFENGMKIEFTNKEDSSRDEKAQ